MANHPNRSKFRHPAQRPDPAMIEAARRAQRMTQRDAANVVYATEAAWKSWEQGHRPMHAGLWELFKVKTFDREVMRAVGLMKAPEPPPKIVLNPSDMFLGPYGRGPGDPGR